MRSLRVMVKFYWEKRKSIPTYGYRPHFVVRGDSEYLGIEFIELELNEFNVFAEAVVKLLYDNVGYHKLKKGVSFDILEGATVVGEGYVL